MSLVPHKIVALEGDTATAISTGKTTVASAVVVLYDSDINAVVLYDNAAFLNPALQKTTDGNGELIVWVTPGEYTQIVNGSAAKAVTVSSASPSTVDTFANMLLLRPEQTGQAFTCQERANAHYILQAAAYTALAGDATFANNRVAALQINGDYNIDKFGAVRKTNSTAAIKNAIIRAAGHPITGNGTYWFNEELLFSVDGSGIHGVGGVLNLFNLSTTVTSVRFSKSDPGAGSKIASCALKNVSLGRNGVSSGAVALKLHNVNQFECDTFYSLSSHTAIEIKGTNSSNFSNLFLFAGNTISRLVDSALITYSGYPLTAGGFTDAYTTNFTNLIASGGFACDHIFDISQSDGIQLSTAYLASPFVSHFNLEPTDAAQGVGSIFVTSAYMDGIDKDTGSLHGLTVPINSGSYINNVNFSSCKFGGFQNDVISILYEATLLEFNGTSIRSFGGSGIAAVDNSNTTISVMGGSIGYGLEAVDIKNIKAFSIVGTQIRNSTKGVKLTNTSKATIDNLTFDAVTTELDITNVPVLSGSSCASDANGIIDVNAGTFTPTFRINFATTGITTSLRQGFYVRNGNVITFNLRIVLTSKGTATGVITVQDMPFPVKNFTTFSIELQGLTSGSGDSFIMSKSAAEPSSGLNIATINSSGNRLNLDNADITDSTEVVISGSYITS